MKSLIFLLAAQATARVLSPKGQSPFEVKETHAIPTNSRSTLTPRYPGDTLVLKIPETAPDNASDTVDRSFPGLAISAHSFCEYAGSSSQPNEVSKNLILSIVNRSGSPVSIRVGGTSADYAYFNTSQEEAIVLPDDQKDALVPIGMRIGSSWFRGFENFGAAVKWTYMAQFVHTDDDSIQRSAEAASQALQHIGPNLEALEIGNEPDMYGAEGFWISDHDLSAYFKEWQYFLDAISRSVNNDSLPMQALDFAHDSKPWSVSDALTAGASQSSSGRVYTENVVSASVHDYMYDGAPDKDSLQAVFMNHTAIANKLDTFRDIASWMKTNKPDIALHLGEVGSSTHPDYATGSEKVLGTFGAALWLADYMLYGMTVGIKRMNVQQSTHFSSASWRPVEYNGMPPAVLPQYYAHPFVADIIGTTDVRILNIETGWDIFSAYAVYDAGSSKLVRVVLINLQTWRTTDKSRPTVSVSLTIGSTLRGTVTIDKLTASGADVQDSGQVTWKDLSWTWEKNGEEFKAEGVDTSTTVMGIYGEFGGLGVQASEAVVVNMEGAADGLDPTDTA